MTFIEVLIALFILVTGILGAVAMQSTAKQGSFDAMQRSLASSLAQDIVERMRNNSATPAVLTSYNGTYNALQALPADRCNTPAANCTNAQITTNDLYEWTLALVGGDSTVGGVSVGGLTNAVGCINHVNQVVTIVISWDGRTATDDGATFNACGSASDKRRQMSLTAFIF